MQDTPIKDFYGRVLGYIREEANGDKKAFDFYKRPLGSYIKSQNVTKDFYGRIIAKGDILSSLIYNKK